MTKLGIIIARFQLFDKNHLKLVEHVLGESDEVLILLGSSIKPRNPLNPFTVEEREEMIYKAVGSDKLFIDYNIDYYNDNKWLIDIQAAIAAHTEGRDDKFSITIYGNRNPLLPDYLNKFPQYNVEVVRTIDFEPLGSLGFTSPNLQEMFSGGQDWMGEVPVSTSKFATRWLETFRGKHIKAEFEYIKNYRRNTQTGKYEVIFNTVDSLVTYKGNILLVERRAQPGKGLWALPGGFLNPREKIFDGAIRELQEETTFRVNPAWLKDQKCFDNPGRSLRGRVITNAFFFEVPDYKDIPIVVGCDDAKSAKWFTMAEVIDNMVGDLFEDHYDIITYFLE